MTDGQWNESFIVNVANNRMNAPETVIWVKLYDTTGGALLASLDETFTKIVITSTLTDHHDEWMRSQNHISQGSMGSDYRNGGMP